MNSHIRDLPVDQRLRLVEDLWDSIAADQGNVELTAAHRQELDRRLDAYRQDPLPGADMLEVLDRVRNRL
ncbi:addiction module protein [Alloalcanivorax gelatiniphagus]|uniref:Addiction module protein n=1 Tax=Alloalcanivorax gelatiniphagus TaxID=1194167 RepID=A0ABY2XPM1_9GAMM|nr:addiction module protein [Alloalcanivorax gelatiniphagus]TMW13595.1 addiction module protein [Alloalcanivorax gelatiniphagus]